MLPPKFAYSRRSHLNNIIWSIHRAKSMHTFWYIFLIVIVLINIIFQQLVILSYLNLAIFCAGNVFVIALSSISAYNALHYLKMKRCFQEMYQYVLEERLNQESYNWRYFKFRSNVGRISPSRFLPVMIWLINMGFSIATITLVILNYIPIFI